MPLMTDKKQAIGAIITKLRGGSHSTSEHSSEALKMANEDASGANAPANEHGDEINSATAVDAATNSLMMAFESKNPDAVKGALFDLFDLFELSRGSSKTDPNNGMG
jgi:hypothetical protein